MKQKREYGRPTMKVVELRHTGMLMVSGEKSTTSVQDYGWTDVVEE